MKDTHPTSIRSSTQASRPYPGTPRPNPSTPRAGPRFFPQNVLQDDEDMGTDAPPYDTSPLSPHLSSLSPLSTPTPHPRASPDQPLPDDLLLSPEEQHNADSPPSGLTQASDSGLAESIHAPNDDGGDHQMSTSALPHTLSAEEQNILTHLALAGQNCAAVQNDGPHHVTDLPQFTPTPLGGFPQTHLAHSAQVFDHLDNKVLLAWFQVEHPKFVVRVFDQTGKDVLDKAAILAERIRANISIVANFIHQEAQPVRVSPPQPQGSKYLPLSFLVYNISPETRDLILSQRVWSATDITFEARPPDLLFCVTGFTSPDTDIVQKTIADVWAYEDNRAHINDILSMSEIPEEKVHIATWNLIRSIRVEHLDFKIAGGLPVPRFNIFAHSPTCDAKAWTELCSYLRILDYPTGLDGCGTAVALTQCPICHSIAHPRGLCPFPFVTQWNGPKINVKLPSQSSRQPGNGRGCGRRYN
ncbi:uncharacterized protein HD556DRAFT_1525100 [Suillus plorans]|uniref:Uncharacterized protein n=1 Tax=Suillus plorans TaxID=116603 RepID=A0A9P7DPG5_9AGAM|nr:uncharacterized protein HD556DRAFT_1525100 [Suillus plorans]KAG1799823.1 hypothetical protein HD556DRAFT_1525100 [Suillus plorans]